MWEPAEAFSDSGKEFVRPQAIVDVSWQFSRDIEKSRLAVDLTGVAAPEGVERFILQTPAGAIQGYIPTEKLKEFCEWTLVLMEER